MSFPQSPETDPPPSPAEPVSNRTVWGPWATLGLGLLVITVFFLGQLVPIAAGVVHRSWWDPHGAAGSLQQAIATDGDVLGAATIVGGALAMALICILALLRGSTPKDYLKLKGFPWWQLPLWLAAAYAAGLVQTILAPFFDREPIPPFMVDVFQSADHPVLLGLGIILMAPLFEEWFFRGFLHEGWRRQGFGAIPSILLTSILWTLIHAQYGWFEKTWIFGFGILLCLAREISGSLWPPIAMHMMNNGLSLIATALELSGEA